MSAKIHYYSKKEEILNVISHAFGLGLSVIGFILLLIKSITLGYIIYVISSLVFGISLILLYAASTIYHSVSKKSLRYKMNIVDHSAIYILIAGTYTPFSLITLSGTTGWIIFSIVWGIALIGVMAKLFFTGRYNVLSTIMYILMGWIVIFAIKPLIKNLSIEGLYWLFAGGIFYTLGAVLFLIDKIKFNHAIFHVFVLAGSFSHFLAIYMHVFTSS